MSKSSEQVDQATEQLLLYSELVGDFAPGKPIRIEFAVFTKTKEVAIQRHTALVQSQHVSRMKRIVERVWRAIEAEHFYPAPSQMACGGCPFREPCRTWPGEGQLSLIFQQRRKRMSARTKFNGVVCGSVLLFAAIMGTIAQSWLMLVAVAIIGTLLVVHAGEVRLAKHDMDFGQRGSRKRFRRK